MGRVNRNDQFKGYYNVRLKSLKYYKYVFFNILYKHMEQELGRPKKASIIEPIEFSEWATLISTSQGWRPLLSSGWREKV